MGTLDPVSMEDLAIIMTIPDTLEPRKPHGHVGPTEIGGGPEGSADELLGKIYRMLKCYFDGDPGACEPSLGGKETAKGGKGKPEKPEEGEEDEEDEL